MATALSTGWSASRIIPRMGGTAIGMNNNAATPQQNPLYTQIARALGIQTPASGTTLNQIATLANGANQGAGPLPAQGVNYLAGAASQGTPAERAANQIATAAETAQVAARNVPAPIAPVIGPRSSPGTNSQSGNVVLPTSVYRAAPTPLQSGLAKAIGIPTAVPSPSPTIAGTAIASHPDTGILSQFSGGVVPGQSPYVSPLTNIVPQALAPTPVANAGIPGVTNFNTLANQNQGMPPWLLNAIQNLNNPDNYLPTAPAAPVGGGFDPRIGATMAATEARIAAQQNRLDMENKARVAKVKAENAAAEHEHELQIQRQRSFSPTFGGYGTGWTSPTF